MQPVTLSRLEVIVIKRDVAQALLRVAEQTPATDYHLEIKTHHQLMPAGRDLKVASICHALAIQTFGHHQLARKCLKIDPRHVRVNRGQRCAGTGTEHAANEQQEKGAHGVIHKVMKDKHSVQRPQVLQGCSLACAPSSLASRPHWIAL